MGKLPVHRRQSRFTIGVCPPGANPTSRRLTIEIMKRDSAERLTRLVKKATFASENEAVLTPLQTAEFLEKTMDSSFKSMPHNCYPEIVSDITLTEPDGAIKTNSDFTPYLYSIKPIEEIDITATSQKLSEHETEDSLSAALIELEKFTTLQSAVETEPMEDTRPEEEDIQSPLDSPRIHDFFSSNSLEDLANRPEWEEIFLQQNTLMEQFVEIVDNPSRWRNFADGRAQCSVALSTSTTTKSGLCELQSSTTQCNFAEEKEKDRRQRNNVASRKSRAMKKERFAAMQMEIEHLLITNRKLKTFIDEMDSAIDEAKAIVLTQTKTTNK
uniref:BZIP domain-containing protein n=1 Tax=Mesocestoides corti TaxID=53468 RepID=A0A5K3EY77_MESCO